MKEDIQIANKHMKINLELGKSLVIRDCLLYTSDAADDIGQV